MTHPSIHARTYPNKIAYQMAGTGKAITYRELDELSNQGAQLFRSLGLKAGDPQRSVNQAVFAIDRAETLDEFGQNEVAPYFDKVAAEVGVSGSAKAEEVWRPRGKPYPMPPMKTFRNGNVWLAMALNSDGVGARVGDMPRSVGARALPGASPEARVPLALPVRVGPRSTAAVRLNRGFAASRCKSAAGPLP